MARWYSVLSAALASFATAADAQSRAPISATLTAGIGHLGGGAALKTRGGYALDALLAARRRSGWLLAAGAGVQGSMGSNDRCDFAPDGACLEDAPVTTTVAALAGWEGPRATLRALAGPAFVAAQGAGGIGLQGRVDMATPALGWVAPTLSLRATLAPRLDGEARRLFAAGIGLRVR
jgi:hypothetical protein